MAVNMAQKRAKKAQRRKQLAALAKREDALYNSLAARVTRAARAPIRYCYINEGLFEIGMGTLVLARGLTSDDLDVGVFLLDTFALGIKDVTFNQMDSEAIESYLDEPAETLRMVPIDPSKARKLLRELAAWSKGQGFTPHKEFAAVERIFGDVDADASDAVFQFGEGGKPVLVSELEGSDLQFGPLGEDPQTLLGDRGEPDESEATD
jgi:hypothetical protein